MANFEEIREEARSRISNAQSLNLNSLDLSELSLTLEDFEILLPTIIEKIPDIEELLLSKNELTFLPSKIIQLTKLKKIDLSDNQIPRDSENLLRANFQNVDVIIQRSFRTGDNLLHQEAIDPSHFNWASSNARFEEMVWPEIDDVLTEIGENSLLPNPQNTNIHSPSNNEGIITMEDIEPLADALDNETTFFELRNYRNTIEKIYGKELGQTALDKIKNIKHGGFTDGNDDSKVEYTGTQIVQKFISKIPESIASKDIFYPAIKSFLNKAIDHNASDKDSILALETMALSVGNCGNPIASTLIQTTIGLNASNGKIDPDFLPYIEREVLENYISNKFKNFIPEIGTDKAHVTARLADIIFQEGIENNELNTLNISGKRDKGWKWLPSKTEYTDFGLKQIGDDLANAFVKKFCKKDDKEKLIKDKDGKYIYNPKPLNLMADKYLYEHGVFSKKEKQIENCVEKINKILNDQETYGYLIIDHYKNDEVALMWGKNEHSEKLRVLLGDTPDNEIIKECDKYFAKQQETLSCLAKILPKSDTKKKVSHSFSEKTKSLNLKGFKHSRTSNTSKNSSMSQKRFGSF